MTSLLIDALLMVALVVTALRSGRMARELRSLRESEAGLGAALAESEAALNRAAEAVVALKYDGLDMLRRLEARSAEAASAEARLASLVARADFHVGGEAAGNGAGQVAGRIAGQGSESERYAKAS